MIDESHAQARSHVTHEVADWLAGISDVGQRHATNQDAFALGARGDAAPHGASTNAAIIAVSDGVSTSALSGMASVIAVETATTHIAACLNQIPTPVAPFDEILTTAFRIANHAIIDRLPAETLDAGACTLIVGVALGDTVTVANVGDCRAYWIGDDSHAEIWSLDDSLAQYQVSLGIPREQAEQGLHAHAITKWLGLNSPDCAPKVHAFPIPGPGLLVMCSDGLWNYASAAHQLAEVVAEVRTTSSSAIQLAELLVAWANRQGGRDNVTVAVARLGDDSPRSSSR